MADNKMVKSSGEHWTCSVLSRLGWAAALTRDGLKRTDILAVSASRKDRRMVEIQVKTCTGVDDVRNSWPIGLEAQQAAVSKSEWFVLVALPPEPIAAPRSFIVPRDHLAAVAYLQHMEWLKAPGMAGRRRAGVESARVRIGLVASYEDKWELLDRPTDEVPVLLDRRFRDLATQDQFRLPDAHPWSKVLPEW